MPRKRDASLVVAGIHVLGHLDGDDLAIGHGPDVVLRGCHRLNDRADAWAEQLVNRYFLSSVTTEILGFTSVNRLFFITVRTLNDGYTYSYD